jgi:drug/metabolite transporter (DMT)-like permease
LRIFSPDQLAYYMGLLGVVAINVLGNVMLKLGSAADRNFLFGILSWQTSLGMMLFASGVLIYSWVLRVVSLHDAQIVASLQYVGVILASTLLLGERIAPMKWMGIGLVAVGIAVCARSV